MDELTPEDKRKFIEDEIIGYHNDMVAGKMALSSSSRARNILAQLAKAKKADRPELRDELPQGLEYRLDSAQLREWMRERSWCFLGGTQVVGESRTWYYMSPNGTKWELVEGWKGKVVRILALFEGIREQEILKIERDAIRRNRSWLANVLGWRNPEQIQELVEEAVKQERERIGGEDGTVAPRR